MYTFLLQKYTNDIKKVLLMLHNIPDLSEYPKCQ